MTRKTTLAIAIASLLSPSLFLAGCSSPPSDSSHTLSSSTPTGNTMLVSEQSQTDRFERQDSVADADTTGYQTPVMTTATNEALADENETIADMKITPNVLMEIDKASEAIDEQNGYDESQDDTLALIMEDDLEESDRPAKTTFKFGFDKKDLPENEKDIIIQHGRFLSQHPEKQIQLHGHSDSQGDAIYNQHLAAARANYIAELLMKEGATKDQIEVVSWGSDKPMPNGTNWSDHRRVEMIYDESFMVQAPIDPMNNPMDSASSN